MIGLTGLNTMTFDQWRRIAKGLRSAYTSDRFLPDADSLKVWYALLKDLPYEQVRLSAQRYMVSNHFPPTPADIRSSVLPPSEDWSVAWGKVIGAVRTYGSWNAESAEKTFDELTSRVVQNLGGFERICELEYGEMDILRASFRNIYTTLAKREREDAQLPQALSEMIQKKLTGGDGVGN